MRVNLSAQDVGGMPLFTNILLIAL